MANLKSKDEEINYYRGQLDSITDMIIKSKAIKQELLNQKATPKNSSNDVADTITAN